MRASKRQSFCRISRRKWDLWEETLSTVNTCITVMKSQRLQFKWHSAKVTRVKKKKKKSCHERFENSRRLIVLSDLDPGLHIRMCAIWPSCFQTQMDVGLQFVEVTKCTFALEFSFSQELFVLRSTKREADYVQMERKESWMKLRLANQTRGTG